MSRDILETLTITLEFRPSDEGGQNGPASLHTEWEGDDVPLHVWAATLARLLTKMLTGSDKAPPELVQALDAWVLDQTGPEGVPAAEVGAALSETLVHMLAGSAPAGVVETRVVGAA